VASKYTNGNGIRYTQCLFWEEWIKLPEERRAINPPFTLYNDKPGLVNGRTTFVDMGDPTGYTWAMKYLGDYEHWLKLCNCNWFKPALEVWQNELKQKVRSRALERIRTIQDKGSESQSLAAAKYLAGFEWEKGSRGRPSKAEVAGELKKQVQLLEAEDDDYNRIKLVKKNG